MERYLVPKFTQKNATLNVGIPASKSILNRALILAAFTEGNTVLRCGPYADDTQSLIDCLSALGISVKTTESGLLVHGGEHFRRAVLNVGSAGTAARFLTAVLAFRGGEYEMHASPQMEKRPMEILNSLEQLGVRFEFLGEKSHFPFRMISEGSTLDTVSVDTDKSTQYASGLLLAAALGEKPFTVELRGNRGNGNYITMTLDLLSAFGAKYTRSRNCITIEPIARPTPEITIEPDVSGACYFFAMALLLRTAVFIPHLKRQTVQGDIRFLKLLEEKDVRISESDEGLLVDGSHVPAYNGFDVDMQDFSDQALTVAVLALFATSPSIIRNIGHTRLQECDRINAIVENINALGARSFTNGEDVFIEPASLTGGTVKTFGDHRVAMAFAVAGLKTGNIVIDDPACCSKTFPNFFEIIQAITK